MAVATSTQTRDVKTPSITILSLTVATALVAVRSPHNGGYGICPILAITGYECPTCGGLRSVHDMAHLDFASAWMMNPLVTIAVPLSAVALGMWWWRAWRNRPAWTIPLPLVLIGAAIVLGFGVLRHF